MVVPDVVDERILEEHFQKDSSYMPYRAFSLYGDDANGDSGLSLVRIGLVVVVIGLAVYGLAKARQRQIRRRKGKAPESPLPISEKRMAHSAQFYFAPSRGPSPSASSATVSSVMSSPAVALSSTFGYSNPGNIGAAIDALMFGGSRGSDKRMMD
ncbi:uncharacterized protein V1510DRAFT_407645 [Dipodascopsis tothii]|uniref:uncharacterized protein n=1 Tax=Dipodascopsis tothii TaxID=44089 RepID=UPI0034CF04F9